MTSCTVFINGNILTIDKDFTVVSALAAEGGRVAALGDVASVQKYIDAGAKVVDLKGKTMMPALYDAHGHFTMNTQYSSYCVDLNSPPIGNCADFAEMLARLKKKAAETPEGEWIIAYGFDDTMIAEKRFPTRQELDSASTRHPIYINHISGHMGILNSLGLERSGITASTPDPEGGVIRREADGKTPNGALEETAIFKYAMPAMPVPSLEERLDAIEECSKRFAALGTTTAIDAGIFDVRDLEAMCEAVKRGRMHVRWLYNPLLWTKEAVDGIKVSSPKISRGGVKFLQDGSIQCFTAYMSKPYHTPFNGDPAYRGYPTYSYEDFAAIVKKVHDSGEQCVIHTNGDQATEDSINAIAEAQKANPRPDARHLLIHAQNAREDQLDRMKELGISASFFSMHIYYWGDRHNTIFLGPERTAHMNPMNSALKRGMISTSHCDAPVVPYTPWLSISTCMSRKSASGQVYGEDQRISVQEALRAHTWNPAWQNFEEKDKGSLEPGKYADMIIIDANPLQCSAEQVKNIKVLETFLGGESIYSA